LSTGETLLEEAGIEIEFRMVESLLFSNKVTGREKCDGVFLPGCGNNRDLRAAFLKIKDRACGISLGKEGILGAGWMILLPRPALARNAAASNPDFSISTIEGTAYGCGFPRVTTGSGARIAVSLTKLVGDKLRIICCRESPAIKDLLSSTKQPLHPAQFYISIGLHL
jgi:hypothetical protein